MALSTVTYSPTQKGIVISIPTLVLSVSVGAIMLFFLLSSLSTCSCPSSLQSFNDNNNVRGGLGEVDKKERISATQEDIKWIKDQIQANGLRMQDNVLRKGINPRTRAQQLQDLIQFKGISHYEGLVSDNNTALPCPGELLVEEHHSNYGEPWAGGRDVFEFLAESSHLSPNSRVLEIGCGTLRVGLHFIRYLIPEHFHCLERDELSLMAAFRYELPSQGLLHKRPLIVKGEDMDFSKFGSGVVYDLIYASAVFLHMPDKLVWAGLERLVGMLKPYDGRIFVSHNIKFCSRLGSEECTKRLTSLGLEYSGKHTHDSLLFNHYEIWFEFRRSKA
ncbi:hypothetical protein NC652_030796 [Populus alba x Populus x berolinensis]|uniref:Methyltransferase type 12 domain-containing protein n=1 Tax=Populus tomentosa TaxID=118781 RepID=A0A8X8CEZ1_POPTO|nr:hypothetical protein POTOM_043901 [Populus tomentosa]KAJ6883666.1 hypothetical protein NC652_030796 [Populus alba x Populus x berolinensis]